MCGRFTLHLSPELLGTVFGVKTPLQLPPRYNIAPSQKVPVVRETGEGGRSLDELVWGLVPSWAKDPAIGNRMINARAETVHEKPSFRHALRQRRCIIPASGYYEWTKAGDSKQPWYITLQDGDPMGLAGLWESWRSPSGDALETFCILTTAANSLMATIHDRMPVILPQTEYGIWLSRNDDNLENITRLFTLDPPQKLTAVKVSNYVNSPSHISDDCIRPLQEDRSETV